MDDISNFIFHMDNALCGKRPPSSPTSDVRLNELFRRVVDQINKLYSHIEIRDNNIKKYRSTDEYISYLVNAGESQERKVLKWIFEDIADYEIDLESVSVRCIMDYMEELDIDLEYKVK